MSRMYLRLWDEELGYLPLVDGKSAVHINRLLNNGLGIVIFVDALTFLARETRGLEC